MLRLPNPPSEYNSAWANQYARLLEQENQQIQNDLQNIRASGVSSVLSFSSTDVNFNSANTDNAISIILPSPNSRYLVTAVRISGASQTLTTATAGLFTAAAGGGVAIVAGGSAITVSTASENTNNNTQSMTVANSGTQSYNAATLYFRVATPQGAAATGDVTITIQLLP